MHVITSLVSLDFLFIRRINFRWNAIFKPETWRNFISGIVNSLPVSTARHTVETLFPNASECGIILLRRLSSADEWKIPERTGKSRMGCKFHFRWQHPSRSSSDSLPGRTVSSLEAHSSPRFLHFSVSRRWTWRNSRDHSRFLRGSPSWRNKETRMQMEKKRTDACVTALQLLYARSRWENILSGVCT